MIFRHCRAPLRYLPQRASTGPARLVLLLRRQVMKTVRDSCESRVYIDVGREAMQREMWLACDVKNHVTLCLVDIEKGKQLDGNACAERKAMTLH